VPQTENGVTPSGWQGYAIGSAKPEYGLNESSEIRRLSVYRAHYDLAFERHFG
jgi:hypothetical protein